jgi:hypothetical protein
MHLNRIHVLFGADTLHHATHNRGITLSTIRLMIGDRFPDVNWAHVCGWHHAWCIFACPVCISDACQHTSSTFSLVAQGARTSETPSCGGCEMQGGACVMNNSRGQSWHMSSLTTVSLVRVLIVTDPTRTACKAASYA